MLATDLVLNASTAITAGASAPITLSLLDAAKGISVRNDPASALTNPKSLRIAHTTRTIKGLWDGTNSAVKGPDLIMDRHLCRLDKNIAQTRYLDPNFAVNYSIQLVLETPRGLGASNPTVAQIATSLLELVSSLLAGSNANLTRILNGET